MKRALLVAALIVLAGCSGLGGPLGGDATHEDPKQDQLGWENGYWYNDSVDVDASDGLDEGELETVVARSMARLEHLRGKEFESTVPVEIVTREEYRENQPFESNVTHSKWNNQVWEALLLVGEDRNITKVFEQAYGSAVLGYYAPDEERIVIVSDSDEPKIGRGTLVHELVHALQDQQFGLDETPDTQDGQLARNGVVEGEASVLETRYQQQCRDNWSCIESHPAGSGGSNIDRGVLSVILYPYVVGPDFVEDVQERGGWDAIDELHGSYPASTEQVTTPSLYPGKEPVNVTVTDRSTEEWQRFDTDPVGDTVGQASLQVMLHENDAGSDGYVGPATDGWAGDTLVPYRSGDRYGYVWGLAWETPADARQFREAYLDALDERGAQHRGGGVYVVPESDAFGDAFRVTRDGDRVRIVNAPAVTELDEIDSACSACR